MSHARFNATRSDRVAFIKERTADLIDYIKNHFEVPSLNAERRIAEAVNGYEAAAMWALKALQTDEYAE